MIRFGPKHFYVALASVAMIGGVLMPLPVSQASGSPIPVLGEASVANTGRSLHFTSNNANVELDPATGSLSGYAWMKDGGWVSFGTTDNPAGPVAVNLSTGVVTGTAHVINTGELLDFEGNNSNVTMSVPAGEFSGHVFSTQFGWIDFGGPGVSLESPLSQASPTPAMEQLMRGGNWWNNGQRQPLKLE